MTTTTLQRTELDRPVGVAAVLVAAAALAAANFGGDGENGGTIEYALSLGVCVVLAALLFGYALPRSERPARAALWCAGLAVLLLPAFWSGLPIVLGTAAVVAGLRASRTVPVVVGALAVVAAIVACVIG